MDADLRAARVPQRRITINLAPVDLPNEGGQSDLAIALGILAASGQIDAQSLDQYEFLGELALTGELRGVDGVLPAAIAAARDGRSLIVAAANSEEAALAQYADVRVARALLEVCSALESGTLPPAAAASAPTVSTPDLRDARPAEGAGGAGSRGGRRASPIHMIGAYRTGECSAQSQPARARGVTLGRHQEGNNHGCTEL